MTSSNYRFGRQNFFAHAILFVCALALMSFVSPQRASAAVTVTICKQTIPSPNLLGTNFTFTGTNSWPPGPNSFNALYQNPFQLQNGTCKSLDITTHDKYNTFTETVPPGWTLSNIHCSSTTSGIQFVGANNNTAFQPGDNEVKIDQNEPSVTCTFVNSRSRSIRSSLTVKKIVSPDLMGLGNGFTFPMNVNCGSGNYTTSVPGNGAAPPIALPSGTTCSIQESASLPALPPGCGWILPPQYAPSSLTISPGANSATVTNGYNCGRPRTASLSITKIVSPDPQNIGSSLSFPMSVNCGFSNTYPVSVPGNTSIAPISIPVGSNCSIAEVMPLPALPANCAWILPPTYSPPALTIAAGANGATVTNGYTCRRYVRSLLYIKKIVNPDPQNIGSTLSFTINATCAGNTTAVPVSGNSTATPITSFAGANCTISEAMPLPALPANCAWILPPTYSPAALTLVPNSNSATVTNGYRCRPLPRAWLSITKKVVPDPLNIGGTLTFPINVNCNGNTSTVTPQGNSTAAPVYGLTGYNCSISEVMPLPALPANCAWILPPTYAPAALTLVPNSNSATVTNGYTCLPPSRLDVTKTFVDATGNPLPIGPLTFGVQVSCAGMPAANLSLVTPGTATTSTSAPGIVPNITAGAQCTLTEPTPPIPAGACAGNGVPGTGYWTTIYAPSQTITIAAGTNSAQITNKLTCLPGTLDVSKVFVDATGLTVPVPIGPLSFNAQVACTGGPTANLTLTTPATTTTSTSPTSSVSNIPIGAQCTTTESPPAIPAGACFDPALGPIGTPVWTTTYAPSQTVTVSAGSNTEQITNTLSCVNGPIGSLTIIKTADWDGQVLSSFPVTFPVQVNCTLPNNTTMSQTVNISVTGNGSFQQTVPNIPIGSVCTISELAPTYGSTSIANFWANMLSACVWHTSYPFTQTVTIQSANQVLQIVNEEMCGTPSTPTDIVVQEEKTPIINGVVDYLPGVSFAINVTCTDPSNQVQNYNWTAASGSTFDSNLTTPIGSTCSWSEPTPPLPAGANSQCYWQTSYFYNGNPISAGQSVPISTPPASGPYNWLNIQNQLICPNGPVVNILPVTRIIQPGGHGGQLLPVCDRATVQGGKHPTCACPKGSKRKDGKCVKQKSGLEDLLGHVTIGVGVGAGGESHSGQPKDTKPPQSDQQGR